MIRINLFLLSLLFTINISSKKAFLSSYETDNEKDLKENEIKSNSQIKRQQVQYFFNRKKTSTLITYLEQERGLKRTQNPYQENSLDMIIRYDSSKRKESQMMLRIQGTTVLGQREPFLKVMEEYDVQRPFGNYNSSFVSPPQYNIFFNKKGEFFKDEKTILDKKLQGVYILKPSLGEQGKGINMIHDMEKLEQDIINKVNNKDPQNYKLNDVQLLQKYVENPLTLNNKKLDYRSFFSIVSTDPLIVLHHQGYARNSIVDFNLYDQTQFSHVINGFIQEQHKDWSPDSDIFKRLDFSQLKYNSLKEHQNLNEYQFLELEQKMLAGVTYAILAAKDKFQKIKGDIEIMAIDWVFDDELNPYMVEINNCPYLTPKKTEELFIQLFPNIVSDFLGAGLDLNVMSKQEIINKSLEDPEFICNSSAYRTKCQLLINEAVDFNYIDSIRDEVDSWSPPNMKATPRSEIHNKIYKQEDL